MSPSFHKIPMGAQPKFELRSWQSLGSKSLAVIITDSFGRADRLGSIGLAIGCAGLAPIISRAGRDLFGNQSTPQIARADELAAGSSVLMGQGDERIPVVLIKNADYDNSMDGIKSTL